MINFRKINTGFLKKILFKIIITLIIQEEKNFLMVTIPLKNYISQQMDDETLL